MHVDGAKPVAVGQQYTDLSVTDLNIIPTQVLLNNLLQSDCKQRPDVFLGMSRCLTSVVL